MVSVTCTNSGLLRVEGLVESAPNRRVKVAGMTARDLESLCVIGVTWEAEMVRLSLPLMNSEDITRLEGHMAEMTHFANEQDYSRWMAPHRQRHFGRAPASWLPDEHRFILDACNARDREAASAVYRPHRASRAPARRSADRGRNMTLKRLVVGSPRPEQGGC
ncbi:MAG: hypothetical protein ACP5H2_09495 [Solirubrobacteraceae bacterium]